MWWGMWWGGGRWWRPTMEHRRSRLRRDLSTRRIGAEVAEGMVLVSVNKREAHLGFTPNGPTAVTLQMPLKVASNATMGGMPAPAYQPPPPVAPPVVQSPMMPQGTTPGITPPVLHPAQGQ